MASETKKIVGNDQTVEKPADNTDRNRKIRNWSIFSIIIAIFVLLMYFSCAPTSKLVTPIGDDGISLTQTDNKYTLDIKSTNGKEYKLTADSLDSIYSNSSCTIYLSSSNGSSYICYIATSSGKISFDFGYSNKTTQGWWFGQYHAVNTSQDDDLLTWADYITTNRVSTGESTPLWYYILQFGPTILLVIFFIYMWRKMGSGGQMGSGDESIFGMGKSQAKLAVSNVKFSDVAGIEEEKEELIEIVDYLKNPGKYSAMGARTPKGVILYGPPGTGKTLLAKAVAGEAKVPFFQVSGSAFDDMLVGVGAKRVRDLFNKARKASPAIIFIDEIDSVASKRGKFDMSGGGGVADQTINQLLAEMDGFSTKSGIVVMAATNRLDTLDDAILRPGRFDRHIQVNLPDIKEREAILKIHSKNKNISSSVSMTDIARRTPGMSGAQLENVLNEATLLAVRSNKTVISMKEIDEGIDRVIAGPAKKSRVISEEERKQIAYHEAGHALVGLNMPGSEVVEKITIIPRGMAAGYTISNPAKQEITIQKKSDLLSNVTTLVGGRASEEIVFGAQEVSTGASNDLYRASGIVRSMVMQLGMSEEVGMTQLVPTEGTNNAYSQKMYSEATALKVDTTIEKILQERYSIAKEIISSNRQELDLIVETLLLLETIVKDQIDFIHKNKELPAEAIARKNELSKQADQKKEVKKEEKAEAKLEKEESTNEEQTNSSDETKEEIL